MRDIRYNKIIHKIKLKVPLIGDKSTLLVGQDIDGGIRSIVMLVLEQDNILLLF